jgi:5-methylcytosine-specific restriction protein A
VDIAGFEIGRLYNRREDMHAKFKGQKQGGISTPIGQDMIFLFTGTTGELYGYKAEWCQILS